MSSYDTMKSTRASILVIQYRYEECGRDFEKRIYARLERELDASIAIHNAWYENINWGDPERILSFFDAVILGGSGELFFDGNGNGNGTESLLRKAKENTTKLIEYILENDFPSLGICFGHQLIANKLGVVVHYDEKQAKAGTHTVTLTKDGEKDSLCKSLPKSFGAQYGHKDSLSDMPVNATLLARGDSCHYSAYRYKENIYSVQFHPELKKVDMIERARTGKSFLPKDVDVETLVKETPEASSLLQRFVEMCR